MRFNKEEKTKKVFLIDFEEVSEEDFYSSLEKAIANEYDEPEFNTYLRDNYDDIEIEGYYYDPSEVLEATGDYDSAYGEWLENKIQFIMEDFDDGGCSSMYIYGSNFEIQEIEEDYIHIELTQQEVNMLYLALSNRAISTIEEAFIKNLSRMVGSEDLEE